LNRKQGLLLEATQDAHAAGTDKRFLATALALESRSVLIDNAKADAVQASGKLAQQALALDAENPDAILAQSFCQLRAGKLDQIKASADKVAHSLPTDGDRQLLLAELAAHENNNDLEQKELEKGLTFANNDPELLYDLGRLYLKGNKAAEAARLLKQAAEQQVHGPEICFALAEACEKSGNAGESLKYYKQSLSQGLAGENSTQAKAAINRLESSK
jgi:tetratricopeptide (TPR) repeat protein